MRAWWRLGLLWSLLLASLVLAWQLSGWGIGRTEPPLATRVGLGYVLQPERELEFALTKPDHRIRLVTTASVSVPGAPDTRYHYSVFYEVLDQAGKTLRRGEYAFAGSLLEVLTPDHRRLPAGAYPTEPQLMPAATQAIVLDLGGGKLPARLRLRLARHDPRVKDVVVRVAMRDPRTLLDPGLHWKELEEQVRTALVRKTPYAEKNLSQQEKGQLLINRWRPLGPVGARGQDYTDRRIELIDSALHPELLIRAATRRARPVLPAGLIATQGRHAAVAIGPAEGEVVLQLQALDGRPHAVTVEWHAEGRWIPETQQLMAPGELRRPVDRGSVVVKAETAVQVRAYRETAKGQHEILTEPELARVYRVGHEEPLRYTLDHLSGHATTVRVAMRALSPGSDPLPTNAGLQLLLRDAQGELLLDRRLSIDLEATPWDFLAVAPLQGRVSEAANIYLRPPAGATQLELRAEQPLWLSAATRPPDRPRELAVPQDYQRYAERASAGWFAFRPDAVASLYGTGRSEFIHLQRPPPERDPRLLVGDYDWQQAEAPITAGPGLPGHAILVARDPKQPLRAEAWSSSFVPIPSGGPQRLEFNAISGRAQITPELLYLYPKVLPAQALISVDQQPLLMPRISAASAQILLPAIAPGVHELQIADESGARWLISRATPRKQAFTRVFATQLPSAQHADFMLSKPAEEEMTITLRLLRTPPLDGLRLAASLSYCRAQTCGPVPRAPLSHDHSLTEVEYLLQAEGQAEGWVLGARTSALADDQRAFLRLGEDLPAGEYRVRLRVLEGRPPLVAVSRLVPGLQPLRKFYQ